MFYFSTLKETPDLDPQTGQMQMQPSTNIVSPCLTIKPLITVRPPANQSNPFIYLLSPIKTNQVGVGRKLMSRFENSRIEN